MKRICSVLLALCAFAACFTWLAACSRTFVTEYTVNTDYDALDSGSIVLGEDVNGVPISEFSTDEVHVPIRAPYSGGTYKTNLNGIAVTAPGIFLKAGFYRFGVSARTVPANGDRVIFEMRVIAPERKEVLGNFSVYQYAFTTEEYEVKEMSFYLEQDAEINLQIFTQNQYDFYVNQLYVCTVPEEECTVQDIADYMRSDREEAELELDRNLLYYFDMREFVDEINDTRIGYDMVNLLVSLQGLVNRDENLLYLNMTGATQPMNTVSVDNFWLDELLKDGGYLEGKTVQVIRKPGTLLRIFRDYYSGLVVWDEDVPATSNVASTACGVENLLPVRYDDKAYSMYNILVTEYEMEVKLDLAGKFTGRGKIPDTNRESTGSKKNDAYLWAYERYMVPGLVSKTDMAYYTDAFSWDTSGTAYSYTFYHYMPNYQYEFLFLGNRDYNIAQKSFFYDLFPYEEATGWTPNDDIDQDPGEDYRTLELLYTRQRELAGEHMIYIHGYNNYYAKYSSGNNNVPNDMISQDGDVANEGVHGRMIAKYYASAMGDGTSYVNVCNRSIYAKMPRIDYAALTSPEPENSDRSAENKYYFAFYMGDYDSSSWPYALIPTFWNDPNRGKIPLMWPVSPAAERFIPNVYEYMYENRTENDYFVGANNGAGFMDTAIMNTIDVGGGKTMLDRFCVDTGEEYERLGLDVMGCLILAGPDSAIRKFAGQTLVGGEKLKAVFSTFWSGYDGGSRIDYKFDGVVVPGIQFDMVGQGMVQPTEDAFTNYMLSFMTEGYYPTEAHFASIRTVLASPTVMYRSVQNLQKMGYPVEVLDPYTYVNMLGRTLDEA